MKHMLLMMTLAIDAADEWICSAVE